MTRIKESFRSFSTVAMDDLRSAPPFAKAGFVGALALGAFHVLGAETIYANIGTRVLENTNGWSSALDTGAALAAASLVLETASTIVVSNAVESFPSTVDHFYERIWASPEEIAIREINGNTAETYIESTDVENGTDPQPVTKNSDKNNKSKSSKKEVALNILGLGSPGYIIQEYIKDPTKTVPENIKTGMKAVGALAIVNFIFGASAATIARNVQHIGEVGTKVIYGVGPHELGGVIPSAGVLPVLETPLFWLSLFAANQFFRHRKLNESNKEKEISLDTSEFVLLEKEILKFEGEI